MDSPWSFFKHIYVVSLKSEKERRENCKKLFETYDCSNYEIFDAVNGKKHPTLKQHYIDTGVLHPSINLSAGGIGCLASHRILWDKVYHSIDSSEPFWTLIFEDDFSFHPLFTTKLFNEYIRNIPSDAKYIKFGHHMVPEGYKMYPHVNKYWLALNNFKSYGTYCYAVHSDILNSLASYKNYTEAVDNISLKQGFYGALDPETVLGVPRQPNMKWILYDDPYTGRKQEYRGIVGCVSADSSTYDPTISENLMFEYLKKLNN
jgi:Glycosyltransferase family 25 (LPS biosynthesis protein)